MNKNRIRLSESQLHQVIKESVKTVLREVRIGGESFHGNNPTDWTALGSLRNDLYYDENNDEWNKWNDSQVERDYENAEKLGGSRRDIKGVNKAIRAKARLGESQLHRVIKESVKKVLNEMEVHNGDPAYLQHQYNKELHSRDNGGYPYVIITYVDGEEIDRDYIYLPKQGLHTYDDEVPFALGSNQALIELDD